MSKAGRPSIVAIVLTARSSSGRLPNKVLTGIEGKPLLHWIAKRLGEAGDVILAIPKGDTVLKEFGQAENLDVFEGSLSDVTGRIWEAAQTFRPNAQFIMRGLGDCPFPSVKIIKRSVEVMRSSGADAFYWALPPFCYVVYGAAEFPRTRAVWEMMNKEAANDEREHADLWFHRNRDKLNVAYHEPPPPIYFRPYRLEVDWKEDFELVRRIAKHFGEVPTLEDALTYLDSCDDAHINQRRLETTGLTVSYTQANRQMWWQAMVGKPIICWDNTKYEIKEGGEPIFCRAKTCLLGFTDGKKLYTKDSVIEGEAYIKCSCGVGRKWFPAK